MIASRFAIKEPAAPINWSRTEHNRAEKEKRLDLKGGLDFITPFTLNQFLRKTLTFLRGPDSEEIDFKNILFIKLIPCWAPIQVKGTEFQVDSFTMLLLNCN